MLCLLTEYPAALVVFAKCIRGRGYIDEKVDAFFLQEFKRREFIVITPAVLAEQAADRVALAVACEDNGGNQVFHLCGTFTRELLQAEEVAGIVEFAIIGQ